MNDAKTVRRRNRTAWTYVQTYALEALEDELNSALERIAGLLMDGRNPNDVAWWLCANHPRFVLEKGLADKLGAQAALSDSPPKGGTWKKWFARPILKKNKRH